MSSGQHISVVDQHATAVEPFEVGESRHPGELIDTGFLPAHDTRAFVPFATFWKIYELLCL